MRIVMAAGGSRGDIQPMLALALGLRARGHSVAFCAPPNFASWIGGEHGLPFTAVGRDVQAFLRQMGPNVVRGMAAIRGDLGLEFERFAEVAPQADLIVGASLHCAGISYAEKQGIPAAYVCYTPAVLRSTEHASVLVPFQRLPRWVNALSWSMTEAVWNLLFRGPLNVERRRLGLPPVASFWGHLFTVPILLASEPALGGPPADVAGQVIQTGAWFLPERDELPAEVERFLAAGAPPVYIGFGSMTDLEARRTTALLLEAVRAAGCRAIVSRGWADFGGDGAPERTSPAPDASVLFVGDLPHGKLFPRVAAVVHHGGAGTTTSAARAGVPQVIVPHILDQFSWADRAFARGLCPRPIPRRRLTARRLAAALRACREDATLAARARELARTIIPDGVDRAVSALEALRGSRAG